MIFYLLLIIVVVTVFILAGLWIARQQQSRARQAEAFYALPQIKALLESGFVRGDDAIDGTIHGFPAGLYCWFDIGGPRYFTFLRCKMPGRLTYAFEFEKRYGKESIRVKNVNMIQQELTSIDGDTLANSFARLQEIAALEKLEPMDR